MMKKIGISFLFIFGFLSQSLWAQAEEAGFNLFERMVPHVGFVQMVPTQRVIDINGTPLESRSIQDVFQEGGSVLFTNFHVGAYTSLFHYKDIVSIGVDASAQVGVRPNINFEALPMGFNVQVPVFLMGRLGTGATKYNQQRFGIGAGIGGSLNMMRFSMLRPNPNPSIGDLFVIRRTNYVNPAAILEASYGNLIGRIQLSLASVNTKATDTNIFGNPGDEPEVIDAIHGMWGFGLIYRFN